MVKRVSVILTYWVIRSTRSIFRYVCHITLGLQNPCGTLLEMLFLYTACSRRQDPFVTLQRTNVLLIIISWSCTITEQLLIVMDNMSCITYVTFVWSCSYHRTITRDISFQSTSAHSSLVAILALMHYIHLCFTYLFQFPVQLQDCTVCHCRHIIGTRMSETEYSRICFSRVSFTRYDWQHCISAVCIDWSWSQAVWSWSWLVFLYHGHRRGGVLSWSLRAGQPLQPLQCSPAIVYGSLVARRTSVCKKYCHRDS